MYWSISVPRSPLGKAMNTSVGAQCPCSSMTLRRRTRPRAWMIEAAKCRRCRSSRTFACCFHAGLSCQSFSLNTLQREEENTGAPHVIPQWEPEDYSGVEVLELLASIHRAPMRRCGGGNTEVRFCRNKMLHVLMNAKQHLRCPADRRCERSACRAANRGLASSSIALLPMRSVRATWRVTLL